MSRGYSFLVRTLLRIPCRDTETGYKFFRRETVLALLDEISFVAEHALERFDLALNAQITRFELVPDDRRTRPEADQ